MSMATVSSPKKRGSKVMPAKWDDDKTRILLEVFEEEIDLGNRPAGIFSKTGWMNIVMKFNSRTGLSLSKDQLKNRQDNLRRDFSKWERLIGRETGLGWDAQKRTLAAPDSWWIEKAQFDPSILKYKENGPMHLDLLQKVFNGTTATGYRAYVPEEDSDDPLLQPGFTLGNDDDIIDFTNDIDVAGEVNGIDKDPPMIDQTTITPSSSKNRVKRRRVSSTGGRVSEAEKHFASVDSLTETVRESVAAYVKSKQGGEESITYGEALKLMKGIPDMGPDHPKFVKLFRVLEDRIRRIAFSELLEYGEVAIFRWLDSFPDL